MGAEPDHNTYMDIQQAINLEILRAFNRDGVEFAYPARAPLTPYLRETSAATSRISERPRLRSSAGSH